jgi:hypothetical protein
MENAANPLMYADISAMNIIPGMVVLKNTEWFRVISEMIWI